MSGNIDRVHLKKVALNRFDIQLLTLLRNTGGEYPMPETPQGKAGVAESAKKNLVCVIQRPGEHPRVRLTDEGRIVLTQYETMEKQNKVEVASSS